jgi:hypothetical protein
MSQKIFNLGVCVSALVLTILGLFFSGPHGETDTGSTSIALIFGCALALFAGNATQFKGLNNLFRLFGLFMIIVVVYFLRNRETIL